MKTKTNLSPINSRPECGAEAPTFLSAVYKRGTQAKKRLAHVRRHLLNKQREQYSYILSAVETHHDMININTLDTPQYFTSILKTFGWIPEEMIKDNDNSCVYDIFKNKMYFTS